MKTLAVIFFAMVCAEAWGADEERPKPESAFPEMTAYLTEPHPMMLDASGGRTDYVVSAKLAELIDRNSKGGVGLLGAAIFDPGSHVPGRVGNLVLIILSGITSQGEGWMSEEQKRNGCRVYRIPFTIDRALRLGFPKEDTAEGWAGYYQAVVSPAKKKKG